MLGIDKKLVIAGKGVRTELYESEIRDMARGNKNIMFVGHVGGKLLAEL